MAKLKNASVLATERKLANSDGKMYSGCWSDLEKSNNWPVIKIQEKSVRGTISNRQKGKVDAAKLDQQVEQPNLQTVDAAALPFDHDTLKLAFTLRVLGNLEVLSACNNPERQAELVSIIQSYKTQQTFEELAKRYAENIANGRTLWRNRIGASDCKVIVELEDNQTLTFDSYEFSLRSFGENVSQDLDTLAKYIQKGLESDGEFVFLKISIFARLGEAQEVFPSQELVLDRTKGDKSKLLYQLDGAAAMHSQKIGNALRTIDTWHPEVDAVGPISIEAFGAVTNRGKAYRPNGKLDFYTLLDNWMLKGDEPAQKQQHYVMGMLIRGGVFGESGKD